ncbi:MAG: rod shape-determining protein MreD [Acidimicrobiia bacterium]|nr:rod shape-determining protein MreD [Acidimicrobiia bacterium]
MGRGTRLALLVSATIVLQGGVFPGLRVFGTVPDLALLVAAAVAYMEGPDTAAVIGFVAGLGTDLFLETPLGLTAISCALTGYALGVLQTGLLRSPRWVAPLLGAAAGLGGGLVFAAGGVVTGSEVLASWRTLDVILRATLYDALLAPLVFLAVGRLLREEREPAAAWRVR